MSSSLNHNEYHLVSPAILDQIELVKQFLEEDPRYSLIRAHKALDIVKRDANHHSVKIECLGEKQRVRNKAIAGSTLAQGFFSRNYQGNLSGQVLIDCAALINGTDSGRYRTLQSKAFNGNRPIIYPDDVPEQIALFLPENNGIGNPVEKALHAHFNILRIHPFDDGNGRVARLVQNGILDSHRYPSIVLTQPERSVYLSTLQAAEMEYRESDRQSGRKQSKFYNFLALKLRDSLLEVKAIIDRTAKKR